MVRFFSCFIHTESRHMTKKNIILSLVGPFIFMIDVALFLFFRYPISLATRMAYFNAMMIDQSIKHIALYGLLVITYTCMLGNNPTIEIVTLVALSLILYLVKNIIHFSLLVRVFVTVAVALLLYIIVDYSGLYYEAFFSWTIQKIIANIIMLCIITQLTL